MSDKFQKLPHFRIKENLEPKLAWLKDWLSLDDKSLGKLDQKFPQVVGLSVEDNLEPKLS
jgi:hypothetical protein